MSDSKGTKAHLIIIVSGFLLFASLQVEAQVSILPGQGVTFSQANFLNGQTRIDSETGWMMVDFAALRAATSMNEGFINVGLNDTWVVRNFPVFAPSVYEYEGLSTTFDLCLDVGDDVSQMDLDVQFSAAPLPGFIPLSPTNFPIGSLDVEIGGEGEGETAPPPAPQGLRELERAAVIDILADNSNQMIQNNHPNLEAAKKQCGPMSVANSLQFLVNTTDLTLPHDHKQGIRGETVPDGETPSLVSQLGEAMGRNVPDPGNRRDPNAGGVGVKSQLQGKLKYLVDNGLQDKVKTIFWSPFGDSDESISYTSGDITLTATHKGKTFGVADIVTCLRGGGDVEAGYYWPADPNDPASSSGAHAVEIIGAGSTTAGEGENKSQVEWIIEASDLNQGDDSKGAGREGFRLRVVNDQDKDGTLNMTRRQELQRMFCQMYVGDPVPEPVETPLTDVDDPEHHDCCVSHPGEVHIVRGPPDSIDILGDADWLPVTGTRQGDLFTATSVRTVAGFPNTHTTCSGTYKPFYSGNTMTCSVGDNGVLAGSGVPIIFTADLINPIFTDPIGVDTVIPVNHAVDLARDRIVTVADGVTYTVNGLLNVVGTLDVRPGGSVVVNGAMSLTGLVLNNGNFTLNPGGSVSTNGQFDNTPTGIFDARGTFISNGGFSNSGWATIGPGGQLVNTFTFNNSTSGDLQIDPGGAFVNAHGANLFNFGANSIHNAGVIINTAESSITNFLPGNFVNETSGTIYNLGSLSSDGSFTNNGDFNVLCGGELTGSGDIANVPPLIAADCIASAGDSDGDGIDDIIDPYPTDISNIPTERNQTRWRVAEIYIATLDRATDAEGLDYWVNNIDTLPEWEPLTVAQSFFDQPEVQEKYPESLGFGGLINALYRNILGRDPDTAGFNYWLSQLQQGLLQRNDMIIALINGAWANPEALANGDVSRFRNRIKVGLAFARYQSINNIQYSQLSPAQRAFLVGSAADVLEGVGVNSNDDDAAIVETPGLLQPLL